MLSLNLKEMFNGVKKSVEIEPKRAVGRPRKLIVKQPRRPHRKQHRLEETVAAQVPGTACDFDMLKKNIGQMDLQALQEAVEQLALVVETEQFWLRLLLQEFEKD
jgi:ribosomal protein S7